MQSEVEFISANRRSLDVCSQYSAIYNTITLQVQYIHLSEHNSDLSSKESMVIVRNLKFSQ